VRRIILCALLCLSLAAPALAGLPEDAGDPAAPLRVQPGEQATPADGTWPLGERLEPGVRIAVRADAAEPSRFRVDLTPLPGHKSSPEAPRACLGLASATRRDLYKTRAVEFRIRASAPVAGILVLTTSNTQDRAARDRSFGSFVIGTQWKLLRLPYGALAPLPGWAAQAARQGLRPGDNVLRPDSVEDLCIGLEAGRWPAGNADQGVTLWIDALRFVR